MAIDCKACGFFYEENDIQMCYQSKKKLECLQQEECRTFYPTQYDGDEAFSPEQHMFLYENELKQKQMGNMQGLHF